MRCSPRLTTLPAAGHQRRNTGGASPRPSATELEPARPPETAEDDGALIMIARVDTQSLRDRARATTTTTPPQRPSLSLPCEGAHGRGGLLQPSFEIGSGEGAVRG